MIADIKNYIEIAAFVAAGAYFLYKLVDGWGLVNLTLELSAERHAKIEDDAIVVILKLTKGDRGSLQLETVELRCAPPNDKPQTVRIPLIYPLKAKSESNLTEEETRVHWGQTDHDRPSIHLPPGESTQYSHVFQVPRDVPCVVEALVLAKRPVSTRRGQWRASIAIA